MKIEQITEQYVTESAGATVFVGFADEKYEGMHPIERWESTSDAQWAARQADKLAVEYSDDIAVVVLGFTAGRPGFEEVHRAQGGVDIAAEVAKHKNDDIEGLVGDKYDTDPEYADMSNNMKQLSRQGR